jgi:hypothetical protein
MIQESLYDYTPDEIKELEEQAANNIHSAKVSLNIYNISKLSVVSNLQRALFNAIETHITKPINNKTLGKQDDIFVDKLIEILEIVPKIADGVSKLQNLTDGKKLNDKIETNTIKQSESVKDSKLIEEIKNRNT